MSLPESSPRRVVRSEPVKIPRKRNLQAERDAEYLEYLERMGRDPAHLAPAGASGWSRSARKKAAIARNQGQPRMRSCPGCRVLVYETELRVAKVSQRALCPACRTREARSGRPAAAEDPNRDAPVGTSRFLANCPSCGVRLQGGKTSNISYEHAAGKYRALGCRDCFPTSKAPRRSASLKVRDPRQDPTTRRGQQVDPVEGEQPTEGTRVTATHLVPAHLAEPLQ